MSGIRDTYGLACPMCGTVETLVVDITTLATLTANGTAPIGDHTWGDSSFCRCLSCNHQATVADFPADDAFISNDNLCLRKDD